MTDLRMKMTPQPQATEAPSPLQAFSGLEQQVIAIAAASSWECAGVSRNPFLRFLNSVMGVVDKNTIARPLANERLEALRSLACITFASEGAPPAARVEAALERGISEEQVAALSRLARREGPTA